MPPFRSPNAQGRQKSCSECVKAKRKCDTAQPQCARCSRQNLPCTYLGYHRGTSGSSDVADAQASATVATASTFESAALTTTAFDSRVLDFPATMSDQMLDFDTFFGTASGNLLDQFGSTSPVYGRHMTVDRPQTPTKPSTYVWTHMAPSSRLRVGHAIEQLTLAARSMVLTNSTLWCHAMFYDDDMPRSMQAAYAACALYIAKNDVNAEFVLRHIAGLVAELSAMPFPTESKAIIARAHALMLYETMLVFSEDVRYFSLAEATVHHLEKVGSVLLDLSCQQSDSDVSLPLYPSTTAHAAWTSYIFRETLRRTVLSLYQLLTVCALLLGRPKACAPSLSRGNSVTISAQLWRAKSSFEFATIWNKKHHFLVHDLDFSEFLRDGKPDDVDEFAKTMLVGLYGIDHVQGWLHTTAARHD